MLHQPLHERAFSCHHLNCEAVENVHVCNDCGVVLGELEDTRKLGASHLKGSLGRLAAPYNVKEDLDVMIGMDTADIFESMLENEMHKRLFMPSAKYLKWRRLLVDWMSELADELELHNTTIHVAVMYLDRFLQRQPMPKDKLQLVAVCCIMIAAKFEEAEENVPTADELDVLVNNGYTSPQIHEYEVIVLNELEWHLTAFTPLHFVGYFMGRGVLFEDDTMQGKPLVPKVTKYMKKYVNFFADLSLQEYSFQQHRPSLVAVAIIASSRKALRISPVWRPEIEAVTGVNEDEVSDVFTAVYQCFKDNFPTNEESHSPSSTADLQT